MTHPPCQRHFTHALACQRQRGQMYPADWVFLFPPVFRQFSGEAPKIGQVGKCSALWAGGEDPPVLRKENPVVNGVGSRSDACRCIQPRHARSRPIYNPSLGVCCPLFTQSMTEEEERRKCFTLWNRVHPPRSMKQMFTRALLTQLTTEHNTMDLTGAYPALLSPGLFYVWLPQ